MANRIYNEYVPYDRPKLPRNKYGLIDTSVLQTGSSMYGSSSGANAVGGSMVELADFRGATETENGVRGAVPAPMAGMHQYYYLSGNGAWSYLPAAKWLTEFPKSDGLIKTGLELDGNLNVTDTITTMNLEVQGAAHFWSLIIDEVKAQGGQVFVSPSMFKVDFVGDSYSYYIFDSSVNNPLINILKSRADIYNILKANNVESVRCRRLYMKCDDGQKAIDNECQIGDMMRCRQFNIDPGAYRNVANKDYWSFIVNTGSESFTDYNGTTYKAFFIDLAYTLRKSDGHNIPLGSTLFADGTAPVFPDGYKEITDAYELKQTSQETWDGSRSIAWPEYFENSEWSDITERVIKVRGLDDQVTAITGKSSSNNLYDNDDYILQAAEMLDAALNGGGNESGGNNEPGPTPPYYSTPRSSANIAQTIIDGTYADNIQNEPDGIVLRQVENTVNSITGENEIEKFGLKSQFTIPNKITLKADTVLEKDMIVTDDVIDSDTGTIYYRKGEVLDFGTTTIADVPVSDTSSSTEYLKFDNENPSDPSMFGAAGDMDVTEAEAQVIESGTHTTTTGFNRTVDANMYTNYSEKDSWQFGYVGYYPYFRITEGDALACLGHLYEETRQNAIVLSSTNPIDPELQAPAMAQYQNIDLFGKSISKFRMTAIAANGNEFIGSFLVNYNNTYVDVNERINLMIMDVKTGLEAVGIHLDGENSTIKLIGSVDLKQHSSGSYDTLSLYDNLDIKRVEIKPFNIPTKNSSDSLINTSTKKLSYNYNWATAPSSYINYDKWKDWDSPFTYSWQYKYELKNYIIYLNTSTSLGYLERGTTVDLYDLSLNLNVPAYLCGYNYKARRHSLWDSTLNQQVTSFQWVLKKNGVEIKQGSATPATSGDDTDAITIALSEINLTGDNNDYVIPENGTYSLEIKLGYKLYAYVTCYTKFSDYYYSVYSNISGSIKVQLGSSDIDDTSNAHQLIIGTNGLVLSNNNSRWLYVADDAFELEWDQNTISFDNNRGLYIKRKPLEIRSDQQIPSNISLVFCKATNPATSYTVTLPSISDFGTFREMTILGWITSGYAQLTIACKGNDKVEITPGTASSSFIFGDTDCPTQTITLISTGENVWRVINKI